MEQSESHPSSSSRSSPSTAITDLDVDSVSHCARFLNLQDVSNLAMTCKYLKSVSYSDSIWEQFYRKQWPQEISFSSSITCGVRGMYLARHTESQQFKFADPLVVCISTDAKPFHHVLFDKDNIIYAQGSGIEMIRMPSYLSGQVPRLTLNEHNARITTMRLYPLNETSLLRSEKHSKENVLVTSSCDHSIRLWWKGSSQRCFRGHNGPVLTLADKLLGDSGSKLLASGGEDGTVRLWSLASTRKRGQHALKATLYGHERPVNLMAVAEHNASLLVTISKDSKVRVWDATTSTAVRSSCCVGMTSVPGTPVNVKCHESLVYVAAGSSVVAIDLRTMRRVINAPLFQPKLHSFGIAPSKSLICAGVYGRALLFDVRRTQETSELDAVAELGGHTGPVSFLHMDPHKIVTGGPEDPIVNVWESETGVQTNSLSCYSSKKEISSTCCSAMAVDAYRIMTASSGEAIIRDFSNCTHPLVMKCDEECPSKFWDPQWQGDTVDSDD